MKNVKTILIFVFLLACNLLVSAAIPTAERQALIVLYNSTNGASWSNNTNWLGAEGTENTWYGVTTDAGNTTVLQLSLAYNNLVGTLPASLGNLSNLQQIYLEYNQLTGSIPSSLGNLSNLQSLHLYVNQLTGSIPTELGNLSNLTSLGLDNNQLTGSIPTSLGNLSNLLYLVLRSNQLTGSIPTELGNLSNLQDLRLYSNQLTGSIPTSLGNLSNLTELVLFSNQLTGSIPASLGNLSNLQWLYLELNQLTGSIPSSLGNLSNLQYLSLSSNQLTGNIPSSLGNLNNLQYLYLSENQLTGSIPSSLGNLSNLQYLWLYSNQLTGSIPTSLGNLSNLLILVLRSNQLTGSIPTSLANLTNLSSSGTDIGYNALHTADVGLINFLNSKDPDWASTQTIAPTAISAVPGNTSVTVSWTPIIYTGNTGGYRVFYATVAGGPYTFYAQTANKSVSSQLVSGLTTGIPYYFVVQTRTDAHANNQNVVDSENSDEATATPTAIIPTTITVTSPNGGESWAGGSAHTITWTSTGTIANVKIEYSTNSGSNWTSVAAGTANDGSYTWTVANTPSSQCLVRVSDAANAATNDASAAVFTIVISDDDIYEDNDTLATAATLTPGTYAGLILRDEDYFKVYVQAGKDLQVSISGAALSPDDYSDMDIELYDASGNLLAYGMSGSTNEMLCLSNVAAGWYFIRNVWNDVAHGYTLTIASGDLPLGEISGRVTDIRGSGIAHVWVTFYEPGGDWNLVRGLVPTDSDGNYRFAYTGGDHRVFFNASNWTNREIVGSYVDEWYNDVATIGEAQTLSTAAGSSLTGINAVLGDAGMITGVVTGPEGQPLNYANVRAYDDSGTLRAGARTFPDGTYQLRGIPTSGNYRVRFIANYWGYAVEWYSNKSWFGAADAVPVVIRQETPNINAQLGAGGTISGRVTDAVSGLPIANVTVSPRDEANIGFNSAVTDAAGQYTIFQVPTCNVKLYFNVGTSGYASEWYNNKASFATADVVPVAAGQNVTGINAQLLLPSITVTSPNGGESWTVGSSHNITWASTGTIANVNIDYSTNNGSSWTSVAAGTTNDGSYNWTVPSTPSTICLVRVRDAADNDPSDSSNAVFTILAYVAPVITVMSPNGGESWIEGSSHDITWSSIGIIANVNIDYSTNSGGSWTSVAANTANDGSYNWTVPSTPSMICLVRVSDAADGNRLDTSNAVFNILDNGTPAITVTSPNGGESWQAGTIHDITWNSSGPISAVKIELSFNGGSLWSTIIASTPNDGSYSWDIVKVPSLNCFMRISNVSGTASDTSDAPFVLQSPPSLTDNYFILPVKWTDTPFGSGGWYVGDYDGDGRSDLLRYVLDGTRNEVLLSTGSAFAAGTNWLTADHGADGWHVGDYNGDGRSDLMRYVPGVSGGEVFLSNGSNFIYSGSWSGAGNGSDGWYIGDFNGDGRDDILRYVPGVSGADVFLSDGTKFNYSGNWSGAGNGADGWYIGDFNGDGRSDLMRYYPGVSGGEVFLSDGTKFTYSGSWTGAGNGDNGWYLGKFSGTGRIDIMRYVLLLSGADVFLNTGTGFTYDGSWTPAGRGDNDWHVGDFNGDGRSDLMRSIVGVTGADVLLSTTISGSSSSATPMAIQANRGKARWLNDVPAEKSLSAEEQTLLDGIKARMAAGEEITIYQVQREYEMLTGKLLTRAGIMKLLKRQKWDDLYRHNGDDLLQ